jgi:hypothetical protein
VRLSSQDYDSSDLSNKFAHLTNNQVNKHFEGFHATEVEGSMMTQEEFFKEASSMGLGALIEPLQQAVKRLAISSIKSVSELMVQNRACFEVFGYDIMVDEDLRPWLIEVNSSPSMDHSTRVTARLVQRALAGLAELLDALARAGRPVKDQCGGWRLVYG